MVQGTFLLFLATRYIVVVSQLFAYEFGLDLIKLLAFKTRLVKHLPFVCIIRF